MVKKSIPQKLAGAGFQTRTERFNQIKFIFHLEYVGLKSHSAF